MSKTRIAPTNLTTGYPSWDGSGNLSVTGNLTATNISAGNNLTVTGSISSGSNLTVTSTISATGGINSPIGFGTNGPTGSFTYFDRNGGGTAGAVFRTNGVNQLWDNNYGTVIAYTSAGNVGINTLQPNQNLTVVGNISATGPISSPTTAKAWVNFNGGIIGPGTPPTGSSLVVTSGSNQITWNYTGAFTSGHVGCIYYFNIGGTNATLGGVNVSTTGAGVRITSYISANQVTATMLGGTATSNQTVNGNGLATGYAFVGYGIRSSYNVSSITKNGTGDYTVNFTTPMADAYYSTICTAYYDFGGSAGNSAILMVHNYQPTITSVRIKGQGNGNGSLYDVYGANVTIFGN
jgi:hypothetical protein